MKQRKNLKKYKVQTCKKKENTFYFYILKLV
jgi:hypothetical protein